MSNSVFPDPRSRSAALHERARGVLSAGNTRFAVYTSPYQIYAAHGAGSRVVDVDGIERIDLQNNMSVLIHGHAHPHVIGRVREQLERGTCFGVSTESEIALAEALCSRVPSFERVRFVNSGTEAVMTALKAARAYTRRPVIAKVEGAYHGSYDYAEVSLDSSPENWGPPERPASVAYAVGTPQSVLDEVLVLPFNDPETALRRLEERAGEVAAVLVDPLPARFGLVPATEEYLRKLRTFTLENGSLLVFDEVISFRLGYHGAQGVAGVTPDLTALAKLIGGGFPVGAIAGRADVMSVFDLSKGRPPVFQGGTFNGNPMTMTAGLATLDLLTEDAFVRLDAIGERARAAIDRALGEAEVPGQATGKGSLFRIHLKKGTLRDYRSTRPTPEAQRLGDQLWRELLNRGFLLSKVLFGALSTVNTEAEVDAFGEALRESLEALGEEALVS